MIGTIKTTFSDSGSQNPETGYSSENDLVDYILGITFELLRPGSRGLQP